MRLLVAGGAMRPAGVRDRDHEPLYHEARLVEIDPATGAIVPRLAWRSPSPRADGVGHCFKGARWDGDRLLLCTEREILEVDPRGWAVTRTWSHPWFNDLHAVARIDGRLHAVSTGLDAVLVLDDEGEVREVHPATDGPFRGEPGVDYRFRSTKPHEVHPNYVFAFDGRVWVTRGLPSDARSLSEPRRTLPIGGGPVHDGLVRADRAWFTTVGGELVGVDGRGAAIRRRLTGPGAGWCRGLCFDEDVVWVGFSRLRATRTRLGLAFVRGMLRGEQRIGLRPTRIAAHDLSTGRELAVVPTEDAGVHAVFAILPADAGRDPLWRVRAG